MYERLRDECNTANDYRTRPNLYGRFQPVVGDQVRNLAFSVPGVLEAFENDEVEDNEIVITTNVELLLVHLDISSGLRCNGTVVSLEDGAVINKQEQYLADIYINCQTGAITEINTEYAVNPQIAYEEDAVKLTLEVLADHDEFVTKRTAYQPYQFGVLQQEDPRTGRPIPYDAYLSPAAIAALEQTFRICNGSNQ